ncbi:hypothetical protein [Pontixanthobacter gangjinensis]|nr:hypothetical protein [Pontixanthobacter gangjinensis]
MMPQDHFELACDRLSADVDAVQFERLRWSRDEGPKLARLVELAQGAVDDRFDMELAEEGASSSSKRFVLKVHSKRIAAVAVGLDKGRALMTVEPIDRSEFSVKAGPPINDDYENVNENWMEDAMSLLFERINSRSGSD